MLLKSLNFIILIAFINTITYFPQRITAVYYNGSSIAQLSGQDSPFHQADIADFDGDTLLECLLDDVFELPFEENESEPDLLTKILNFLVNMINVPVKFIEAWLLPLLSMAVLSLLICPFGSFKRIPAPGYYLFLFRLKPF